MDNKGSMGNVISSYRKKRQQSTILFVYGAAGLLVVAGLALLIIWLTGPSKPLNAIFATDTPTPTLTFTPTNTSIPTDTPTITLTPTQTATATPSGPFSYTVQQGDYLSSIVSKFTLGDDGIPLIMMLNPFSAEGENYSINQITKVVYPGQQIWLPGHDSKLPTPTPIPPNLPRGTKVNYVVGAGDSLAGIAAKFNSTVDDIVKENKLTDANSIFVGQTLVIPVNLVTPTATRPPTSTPRTPVPPGTPTAPSSPTP
jgi:LysM repeat protein